MARDWYDDESVYILDFYDPTIEPQDKGARSGITAEVTIGKADNNQSYITKIQHRVNLALSEFSPDFVIYNAGYDILPGDKKGKMDITDSVVMLRDEVVFREVIEGHGCPILMTVGSCYQKKMEEVVTRSIRNLVIKFDLSPKILQASSASNMKYSNTLMRKKDKFSAAEYESTATGVRGSRTTKAVAFGQTMFGQNINSEVRVYKFF